MIKFQQLNQKGIAHLVVPIVIVLGAAIVGTGYFVAAHNKLSSPTGTASAASLKTLPTKLKHLPTSATPFTATTQPDCYAVNPLPGHPGGIYCKVCVGVNPVPGQPGGIRCSYQLQTSVTPVTTPAQPDCYAVNPLPGHPGGIYCKVCVGVNPVPGQPGGIRCSYQPKQ